MCSLGRGLWHPGEDRVFWLMFEREAGACEQSPRAMPFCLGDDFSGAAEIREGGDCPPFLGPPTTA